MDLARRLRRLAIEESTSEIARVTAVGEFGYDVETTAGGTISALQVDGTQQYTEDAWVVIERTGPHWRIVGRAPHRAS